MGEIMNEIKSVNSLIISVTTCVALFVLWFCCSFFGWVSPLFVPSPSSVWAAFINIAFENGYKEASLWNHLAVSMFRIGTAFLFSMLLAVPVGLLCGYNSVLRAIIAPIVYFYRPLPPLAYYTVLIIWLGIGDLSKISLLFLAGFAPLFLSCVSAVENVDPARIAVARTLGASPFRLFCSVIIPSCLPEIFTGLRTALGFIYTTLVAAEMVAAVSGIGWMVLDASKFLQSDIMFVGIIVMGVTGILLDICFLWLERAIIPWKGRGN
jgi:taurine transport system permease protein